LQQQQHALLLVSFPRRRIDSPVIAFATAARCLQSSRQRRSETIGPATFPLKGSRI
jgi:hypothetical protein